MININKFHKNESKFIPPASTGQPHRAHTQSKMAAISSDVARASNLDGVKWYCSLHFSNLHLIIVYHLHNPRQVASTDEYYFRM